MPLYAGAEAGAASLTFDPAPALLLGAGPNVGGRRQVHIHDDGWRVLAWVAADRISDDERDQVSGVGIGKLGTVGYGAGGMGLLRRVRCEEALELSLSGPEVREVVGTLAAGEVITIRHTQEELVGFQPVTLDRSPVRLERDWKWTVRVEALDACAPAT